MVFRKENHTAFSIRKEVIKHMSNGVCLLIGLLLGGCVAGTLLCCLQMNRISEYEQEIRRLRQNLNDKI